MDNVFSVSDAIAVFNQTFEYAYPTVSVQGEVASFKVNQGKYVFFDIKDETGSLGCFMTLFQLRTPIEDGMKVVVTASPKITAWGKFSLTVRSIRPVGEGSIKKSFELLKAKLEKEGLFAPERKRLLPDMPSHIAVISSTQAAGYADFIKIIGDRWGGMKIEVAHTQVQGADAPEQIIRALRYFNQQTVLPEAIVIIRGGGSADDLAAFNDEPLVRAIAESRVPILTGIGHEVDTTLADYVADVRAATPSNAAQLLVPDRHDMIRGIEQQMNSVRRTVAAVIDQYQIDVHNQLEQAWTHIDHQIESVSDRLSSMRALIEQVNPERVLERGYALVRGEATVGKTIEIETAQAILEAEVTNVRKK